MFSVAWIGPTLQRAHGSCFISVYLIAKHCLKTMVSAVFGEEANIVIYISQKERLKRRNRLQHTVFSLLSWCKWLVSHFISSIPAWERAKVNRYLHTGSVRPGSRFHQPLISCSLLWSRNVNWETRQTRVQVNRTFFKKQDCRSAESILYMICNTGNIFLVRPYVVYQIHKKQQENCEKSYVHILGLWFNQKCLRFDSLDF